MSDLKETLAAIKLTNGMRDRIHAELGIKSSLSDDVIIPADMYFFEFRKPDLESKSYSHYHGKCIGKGQKELVSWGYEFTLVGTQSAKDKRFAGTGCMHCGKRLDEKEYEKQKSAGAAKRKQLIAEYAEEQKYREEWEMEQILMRG